MQVSGSVKFDDDRDIIFMFEMRHDIDFHLVSVFNIPYESSRERCSMLQNFRGSKTETPCFGEI